MAVRNIACLFLQDAKKVKLILDASLYWFFDA